jgi:hypothetical protein
LTIRSRLPRPVQILPVYGLIVAIIYGWTLFWFFWRLPSWLFYLEPAEILSIFAYSMAADLVESVLVLGIPVGLGWLLPEGWFKGRFVLRGSIVALCFLGGFLYLAPKLLAPEDFPKDMGLFVAALTVLLAFLLVTFSSRVPPLERALEDLADRTIILLYLSIPISLVSLLLIAARNLR